MKATSTMIGGNRYELTQYDPIGREALRLNCSVNLAPVDAYSESPLTIERQGIASDGGNGIVDDLTLSYRGNQLIRVEDSADPVILENSMDFATSAAEYEYDSDGRLISDTGRGITNISYYNLDLPYRIDPSNAKIHYCYSADGQKLSTKKETVSPFGGNRLNRDVIHYYFGPFELNYTKYSGSGTTNLLRINMPWGYYDGAKAPHFYHKDWQGNIRAVTDQSGRLEQATDYYPYGMPMTSSIGSTVNPYKFGAKELETESALNHYDFHARWLPASIPLFTTPDPKAADYTGINPYLYCAANPITNIDPSGKKVVIANANDQELFKELFDSDVQQYLNFDDEGLLNHQTLSQGLSDSWIFRALTECSANELIMTFETNDAYNFKDNNDNVKLKTMGEIEFEGELYMDIDFKEGGLTTGETGFLGKTLLPGKGISNSNSIDDNIHIVVNKHLSDIGKKEMIGHEFFGHGYMFIKTRNRFKSAHQYSKGLIDNNVELLKYINQARKEIVSNQNK